MPLVLPQVLALNWPLEIQTMCCRSAIQRAHSCVPWDRPSLGALPEYLKDRQGRKVVGYFPGTRACCCPDGREVGTNPNVCHICPLMFRVTRAIGHRSLSLSLCLCFSHSTVSGDPAVCAPGAAVCVSDSLSDTVSLCHSLDTSAQKRN